MNRKKIKNIFRYIWLIILMFISAINYNLFLNPNNIISGGGNGLSIIFEKLLGIEPAIFILMFNVIILIFSFIVLGVEVSSSSIVAIFVYPFFVLPLARLVQMAIRRRLPLIKGILMSYKRKTAAIQLLLVTRRLKNASRKNMLQL